MHGLPQSTVQASRVSEGIMERCCRCHLLCFALTLFLFSFPNFIQFLIFASCISVWPLLFFCSQGLYSNNFHSHTSVWFSSSLFGSVQAASATSFMYNNQRVQSHLQKVPDFVCVCVCVFQTDPVFHRTAAHLVCLLNRQ